MRGKRGPRKHSPASEVSPSGGRSGGPAARVDSPVGPQRTPGHPSSSSGILGTMLQKATAMPGALDVNPVQRTPRHFAHLHRPLDQVLSPTAPCTHTVYLYCCHLQFVSSLWPISPTTSFGLPKSQLCPVQHLKCRKPGFSPAAWHQNLKGLYLISSAGLLLGRQTAELSLKSQAPPGCPLAALPGGGRVSRITQGFLVTDVGAGLQVDSRVVVVDCGLESGTMSLMRGLH